MGPTSLRVEGPKLALRPLRRQDAAASVALRAPDEVRRFLNGSAPRSLEETQELFLRSEELFSRREAFYMALELRDGGAMVGDLGVRFPRHHQQANLGYTLGPAYWGRGLMTEAVALATHMAFELCHAVRVDAQVQVGNHASRRVLEKNGFSLDGTLRRSVPKDGGWRDEWYLTLLREEWLEAPDRLEVQVLGGL